MRRAGRRPRIDTAVRFSVLYCPRTLAHEGAMPSRFRHFISANVRSFIS
jgi:hypothetical protein